ncbi:MAG: acyl-CoA dehydrogenase family protein [Thermoanaerobaculia bacterium]|nr:acyl-CoA dehydrogenase family protein [Thermoanaerobaculia bacterium]
MSGIQDAATSQNPKSPYYSAEHLEFRHAVSRFVREEIEPHIDGWEEAGSFPTELYRKAAVAGILGLGFPARYGGLEKDHFHRIIAAEEMSRAGAGGLTSALMNHGVAMPPVVAAGSEALKARVLPGVLAGEKICALAVTEPSGGSDVAGLRSTAVREGRCYVVNGAKSYITSGTRADYFTVAVRTGGSGPGGLSLLLIERDAPGFQRRRLKTMGWACADIAVLEFSDCRVPLENLIGAENQGFGLLMQNFALERLFMIASCNSLSRVCYEDALAYARQRQVFGEPLIAKQVIRHKLTDMAMAIRATQAYLEQLVWLADRGEQPTADICLLKNQASLTMERCAREALQIFGGAGYVRGTRVERIYREVRVNAIGGGAEEVMRDFAAANLGY